MMALEIHQVLATHHALLSRNHCYSLLDCANVKRSSTERTPEIKSFDSTDSDITSSH